MPQGETLSVQSCPVAAVGAAASAPTAASAEQLLPFASSLTQVWQPHALYQLEGFAAWAVQGQGGLQRVAVRAAGEDVVLQQVSTGAQDLRLLL